MHLFNAIFRRNPRKSWGGGVEKPLGFLCAILALFFISFNAHAATLNFRHNGTTKQIELDTTKRTAPALAMRVGNTTYYANLVETGTCASGNACVSYGNKTYKIHDNIEYKFTIKTTNMPAGTEFSFSMSAAGNFTVDWGDGNVEEIVRPDTTGATYSHTYTTAGVRTIGFGGLATKYSTNSYIAAIKFHETTNYSHQKIAAISGSLGAIFPTIDDGTAPDSQPRFFETFYVCSNLTELPSNLFSGISGTTDFMFCRTFYGCRGLTELPPNLFSGVSGSASSMFEQTFYGCSNLEKIPAGLFSDVSGAAHRMFRQTFSSCDKLKTIPGNLFSGVTAAESYMFDGTFYQCAELEKLPNKLFSNVTGTAPGMFYGTFNTCPKLSGTIPFGLFGNISGAPKDSMFGRTFRNCPNLTGPTARMADGTRLYDVTYNGSTWYTQMPSMFTEMYSGTPDVKDPVADKFTITTTDMDAGTEFSFSMSAMGSFVVDWGDGTTEYIYRPYSVVNKIFSHTYMDAGVHTIKMGGVATGYSTDNYTAAISFYDNKNIAKIDGSLGAIFPTLGSTNGKQPMFAETFSGCTGLIEIPGTLFSGVSGAAYGMFYGTFMGCSGLKSLPSGLFSGVSGSASSMFEQTFKNCYGLKYEIPLGFFGKPSGAPALYMFYRTFYNCVSLRGSTARIYDENNNLIPLYNIMYNGQTWLSQSPDTFTDMYTNTQVADN